jgi:hypothetical protein
MKRIALSMLTAAISTTAIAPVAFAAPDFDALRQGARKTAIGMSSFCPDADHARIENG